MDGFQRGAQVRENMDARKRQKVLQERQDVEYNRQIDQRNKIDDINKQAQAAFDGEVKAGTMSPEDFDSFWNKYTIPKLKQAYLLNGDMNNAEAVQKWGDSEEAREGGRLFTSSLLKAQTGDAAGAIDDVMKLGKLKGYMSHGYEVLGQESITNDKGQVGGYRIKLKTPDGKELLQDIRTEDLPRLIATFGNPQAAMESQIAASTAKAKADQELDTYRKKKAVDKEFGVGKNDDKLRADAVTALRKRMDGGLAGDEAKFDDLSRDEQEKLIAQEIDLVRGQPGLAGAAEKPAERKVVVDSVTGKTVDPETKRPTKADGSREPVKREQQGPVDGRSSGDRATALMLQQAAAMLSNGVPPEDVGQSLVDAGIPPDQWPDGLKAALARAKQNAIGLGRAR
jgi:hypothetical protein